MAIDRIPEPDPVDHEAREQARERMAFQAGDLRRVEMTPAEFARQPKRIQQIINRGRRNRGETEL